MKNKLTTLRLLSPLFPHIYRKNEWGDYENDSEDLTAGEVLEYEDECKTSNCSYNERQIVTNYLIRITAN